MHLTEGFGFQTFDRGFWAPLGFWAPCMGGLRHRWLLQMEAVQPVRGALAEGGSVAGRCLVPGTTTHKQRYSTSLLGPHAEVPRSWDHMQRYWYLDPGTTCRGTSLLGPHACRGACSMLWVSTTPLRYARYCSAECRAGAARARGGSHGGMPATTQQSVGQVRHARARGRVGGHMVACPLLREEGEDEGRCARCILRGTSAGCASACTMVQSWMPEP